MRLVFAIAAAFLPFSALLIFIFVDRSRRGREFKNPLTSFLLRPAGESLRLRLEALEETVNDQILRIVGASAFLGFGVWAGFHSMLVGVLTSVIALSLFGFFARQLTKTLSIRRDCYLGFLGERAIGEELNQLLAHGWSVFHDVAFQTNPGSKPFNIDHVVVGTGGIFAIETKTRRKRRKSANEDASNVVIYTGSSLVFPWGDETFGVCQARKQAESLKRWLSDHLKEPIAVTPVLALPGWFVERKVHDDLSVISGREIKGLFHNEHLKTVLDEKSARAVSALLDQKCRDVGGG